MTEKKSLLRILATMPPAVMLLIVIGMAVVVTMMVTGRVEEETKSINAKRAQLESTTNSTNPVADTSRPHKTAFYAVTYIPYETTIEAKQIEKRQIGELELWDDAVIIPSEIVGHSPKHTIPANAQIRQGDLQ